MHTEVKHIVSGVVSSFAVSTTVLQFLSGVLVCKHYYVNKTTAEASPLPFLCGIISCGLWLLYGIMKQDYMIAAVNAVGEVLMIIYTTIFYIFTFKKSSVEKQILLTVAYMLLMSCYLLLESNIEVVISRLGTMACAFTLLTVAAPMSKLLHVLRVKNTECLPFPMILMSFFVSSFWYLYGLIAGDVFLMMPNFIGAGLAMSQLTLFCIYPNKPTPPNLAKSIVA